MTPNPKTPSERFLDYMRNREASPTTIATYASLLKDMEHSMGDLLQADVDEAEVWWEDITHLSASSRARALTVARQFYKWAMRYDLIDKEPTRRLDPPSKPKGAPRYITRAQLDALLDGLPKDLRRAVALGAWAGMRVSEVAALDWSDVDVDMRRIHVRHGKGNKSRAISMHPILLDALLPDTGGNVVTAGGEVYTGAALQRRANRAFKRLGVDATFHQLRHRYGTLTYGATGDPLAVAAAMGHASLESTRIYAAVSDDALDRVAAAAVR